MATTFLLPKRCTQIGRQRREDHHRDGLRDQHRAGLDRREAEHRLQVLRQQEQRAEQREEHERDRAARRAEPWVLEEVHVEHRMIECSSQDEERREHAEADDEAGDDLGSRSSPCSAPR